MDKLIEELTALEEKATKKKWHLNPIGKMVFVNAGVGPDERQVARFDNGNHVPATDADWANAKFACALVNAFPALKREREELIGALREIKSQCHNMPRGASVDKIEAICSALLSRVTKGQ